MTTFLEDESSIEDNKPEEFYDIDIGNPAVQSWRISSSERDIIVNGTLYTATASARTEVSVAGVGRPKELQLVLPVSHPLVKRYLLGGVPPKFVYATVWRRQVRSQTIEQLFQGRITSLAVDGRVAKFRVPSRFTETMLRVLPNLTAGRQCPHILYDSMCQVDRTNALFNVSTTAILVQGRTVRYDQGNTAADQWPVYGELLHIASGERMTILKSTYVNPGVSGVQEIEMQMAISGLKTGDAIQVFAGCNKSIEQCNARFSNRHNFGGFNRMPNKNVWKPNDNGFDTTGEL